MMTGKSKHNAQKLEFVSFEQAQAHFFPKEVETIKRRNESPEEAGKRIAETILSKTGSKK